MMAPSIISFTLAYTLSPVISSRLALLQLPVATATEKKHGGTVLVATSFLISAMYYDS